MFWSFKVFYLDQANTICNICVLEVIILMTKHKWMESELFYLSSHEITCHIF